MCFDSKGKLCVDSGGNIRGKEDVKKEYYAAVGTYVDLILQKAMKVLYKSVEEEPDMLDFYLDLGKKVKETAWEQTTQITAG